MCPFSCFSFLLSVFFPHTLDKRPLFFSFFLESMWIKEKLWELNMCTHDITLSFLTTGHPFFPQTLFNLHSQTAFSANNMARDFLNSSLVEGYWQWKENSGQVWEGSLRVFPVGISVSMLLSTQLIMLSSRLFFSGPTERCHTFWWRDTDLHHRAPSVCSGVHRSVGTRSWYAYWWRALPAQLPPAIREDAVCVAQVGGWSGVSWRSERTWIRRSLKQWFNFLFYFF